LSQAMHFSPQHPRYLSHRFTQLAVRQIRVVIGLTAKSW
jgi:hypothetical protein